MSSCAKGLSNNAYGKIMFQTMIFLRPQRQVDADIKSDVTTCGLISSMMLRNEQDCARIFDRFQPTVISSILIELYQKNKPTECDSDGHHCHVLP